MPPLEPVKPTLPVPRTPVVRRERRRQQGEQPVPGEAEIDEEQPRDGNPDSDSEHTIDEYV